MVAGASGRGQRDDGQRDRDARASSPPTGTGGARTGGGSLGFFGQSGCGRPARGIARREWPWFLLIPRGILVERLERENAEYRTSTSNLLVMHSLPVSKVLSQVTVKGS